MSSQPILDRAAITEALRRLGERLAYRGMVADLYVFGGAAMALAYDLRRSTRDVDAVFQPHGAVVAEAPDEALPKRSVLLLEELFGTGAQAVVGGP